MKKYLSIIIMILMTGCTVKVNQVLPSPQGKSGTIKIYQTDEANVPVDADVPVVGQGMAEAG